MLAAWYVVKQLLVSVFTITTDRSDVAGVIILASVSVVDVCLTDLLIEGGVQSSSQ